MIDKADLRTIAPNLNRGLYSAENVSSGIPIPKARRIELFSPEEWEEFTEEWASSLQPDYFQVRRFAGSGDQGLDVVGFVSSNKFENGWDNYQCKHYESPLGPSDIWIEIGKMVYYTYLQEFPPPRHYFFVASRGVGTKLGKWLALPEALKNQCRNNWKQYCETKIAKDLIVRLEGDMLRYFEEFDFSIFSSKSLVNLIEGHSKTPFHTVRFGGGFPMRPTPIIPPQEILPSESRYIEQLYEAYSDHTGKKICDITSVEQDSLLKEDFLRQRERFYHAESLRNFARDTVPPGTFEDLQDDIFQGVIDVCEQNYADGLLRMRATVSQSASLSISSSLLSTVTKIKDKQGICHQLANEDRLQWMQNNE